MSAPSLRVLQQWVGARVRGLPADGAGAGQVLNPQRGTPGLERLAVYAGGYRARTREALAEVYEAVRHLLGERAFSALADAYVARYPSHDYNLTFVGRHLPEFLPGTCWAERLPFLPDLARLEWQVCRAFHAADAPPLDVAALSAVPPRAWDRVRLTLQPSVGLVSSAWPIRDLWEARRVAREAVDIAVVGRPQDVVVFRRGFAVACELLEPPQAALLRALAEGRPLGEACAPLAGRGEQAPAPLEAWFARWAAAGLFRRCELPTA